MKIIYDGEAEATYIKLREGLFERSDGVKPGLIIDVGKWGGLLAKEILAVGERGVIAEPPVAKIELLSARNERAFKE